MLRSSILSPPELRDTQCELGDKKENTDIFEQIKNKTFNKEAFYSTLNSSQVSVIFTLMLLIVVAV